MPAVEVIYTRAAPDAWARCSGRRAGSRGCHWRKLHGRRTYDLHTRANGRVEEGQPEHSSNPGRANPSCRHSRTEDAGCRRGVRMSGRGWTRWSSR